MDGLRGRGSWGVWHHGGLDTAALDPGVWYSTVYEGGCRSMAALVREDEIMRPSTGRGREERGGRGGQGWSCIWGDRRKLERF